MAQSGSFRSVRTVAPPPIATIGLTVVDSPATVESMNHERERNPEWDPVFKSNYRTKLLFPSEWVRKAQGLLDSAKLLEPEVVAIWDSMREWHKSKNKRSLKPDELLSVHLMLVAFAIENLFKAALVRDGGNDLRQEFDSTGKLPRLLKTHDLFVLATKTSLPIGTEEEDLLRRLTRAAIWAGRYALPIDFSEIAGSETFSDGKQWSVAYLGGNDIDRLRDFVEKIRRDLSL